MGLSGLLPKSLCWNLVPSVMVFGGVAFARWRVMRAEPSGKGLALLQRRAERELASVWKHSKQTDSRLPTRRPALSSHCHGWHCGLHCLLWAVRTVRSTGACCSATRSVVSATAAWVDWHTPIKALYSAPKVWSEVCKDWNTSLAFHGHPTPGSYAINWIQIGWC